MSNDEEVELDFLRFFYTECYFGPAHEDVIYMMQEEYTRQGNKLPKGYGREE